MRPFLTDSTPNRWPATEQRQPCLLAFNIEESRRLKRAETHYFDHPAFGAILYFNVHAPEPPPEEPAPAGAP